LLLLFDFSGTWTGANHSSFSSLLCLNTKCLPPFSIRLSPFYRSPLLFLSRCGAPEHAASSQGPNENPSPLLDPSLFLKLYFASSPAPLSAPRCVLTQRHRSWVKKHLLIHLSRRYCPFLFELSFQPRNKLAFAAWPSPLALVVFPSPEMSFPLPPTAVDCRALPPTRRPQFFLHCWFSDRRKPRFF